MTELVWLNRRFNNRQLVVKRWGSMLSAHPETANMTPNNTTYQIYYFIPSAFSTLPSSASSPPLPHSITPQLGSQLHSPHMRGDTEASQVSK